MVFGLQRHELLLIKFGLEYVYNKTNSVLKVEEVMPFGIQPIHLLVIAIVALIIFGPSRLPEIGRGIGRALNEFKRGTQEMSESFRDEVTKTNAQPGQAQPPANTMAESRTPPGAQIQESQAGNFCPKCGQSNLAGAKFCNSCGAALPVQTVQ